MKIEERVTITQEMYNAFLNGKRLSFNYPDIDFKLTIIPPNEHVRVDQKTWFELKRLCLNGIDTVRVQSAIDMFEQIEQSQ